jgi:hypothetical protein
LVFEVFAMLLFIWLVLSAFILTVTFWSYSILFQQKNAWKSFAQKRNLNYQPGGSFFASPVVTGNIGTYTISLQSEAVTTNDSRGQRYNTVIEVALRKGMPIPGAIGTVTMAPIIYTLTTLNEDVKIDDPEWDNQWVIRTVDKEQLICYLTPARREAIKKLFKMKIISGLFVFDRNDAVFRIETVDPLHNADKVEKVFKAILPQMETFIPVPGEEAGYAVVKAPPVQSAPVPVVAEPVIPAQVVEIEDIGPPEKPES